MNLVFGDASLFKKFVDGISVLVDEAEFVVSENGLSLKATDPSQISLVDFRLPKSAFKKFDVKETSTLGLDLNYFGQVMSRAKSNDSVEFSFSGDASKLAVVFSGKSRRAFTMPLLDLSSGELPLPKIDFDAVVKIRADALNDSLKDASLISTHILLSVESDSFFVRANSSKGNLENIYTQKDESVVSLKASGEARAMFPLDYLASMVKASSADTELVLSLKTNAPLQVDYSLGEGKLQYFLAPRIESDSG